MQLSPIAHRFIHHWGDMGSSWGVNRTVAQIHALLFFHGRPLNAEEIAGTLGAARSNVSNSLKELQDWELIRISRRPGDRRCFSRGGGCVCRRSDRRIRRFATGA